jgi:hypothetical protein
LPADSGTAGWIAALAAACENLMPTTAEAAAVVLAIEGHHLIPDHHCHYRCYYSFELLLPSLHQTAAGLQLEVAAPVPSQSAQHHQLLLEQLHFAAANPLHCVSDLQDAVVPFLTLTSTRSPATAGAAAAAAVAAADTATAADCSAFTWTSICCREAAYNCSCLLAQHSPAAAAAVSLSHLDQHKLINCQHSAKLLSVIIAAAAAAATGGSKTHSKQQQITGCRRVLLKVALWVKNGRLVASIHNKWLYHSYTHRFLTALPLSSM